MTAERLEPSPAEPANLSVVQTNAQASMESGLAEALVTIRKRKWIILGCVLAGLLYGYYKSATQPLVYNASGTIEIRSGSSNQFRVGASQTSDAAGNLPTQVAILKSDSLLLTVARDLDLANNRDFRHIKPEQALVHLSYDDPSVRVYLVSALSSDIDVAIIPKTDLIRITCTTFSAKLSADIVNKLITEYIHRSFQSRYDATQRASDFLTAQLRDLKQQVEDSQARLIDLGKRVGNVGLDSSKNQISIALDDLSKAAGEAQIQRILVESRYRVLSEMDPSAIDPSIDSRGAGATISALPSLRAQREGLLAQYAELTSIGNLGPANPRVTAVKAQIDELAKQIDVEQKRVLIQAKQELVAARTNEEQTRAALEAEKTEAYKLRDDLIDYTLRQREFESSRTLYEGLLERLRTAGIQAGLESTEIDIVDNATPPLGPTLQARSTILMVNTLVMLIIGLTVAFIIDSLDAGIQSISDLERVLGLPSLAMIPRGRRTADQASLTIAQRNIGVLSGPKSQFAEAFRSLRTSLLLSSAGKEPQVILLTSATPSEGKTTAAANLACVLAQRNVRVLLIDADLRRPTVHHRFGINGKIGLTSVLSGSTTLQKAIQNFGEIPTLDILVSGPVPPFPTEMLGSQAMQQLLTEARGIYTHIVLDSPPLLSVTDSVVLAREADTVVLIVRHGKSNKHAIRRSRDLLVRTGARLAGIALNAVDLNSPEYNAYYGYYGYGGYSGYASAGVDSSAWESQSSNKPRDTGNDTSKGDLR